MKLRPFLHLRQDLFDHALVGFAVGLSSMGIGYLAGGLAVGLAASLVASVAAGWGCELYQAAFTKDRQPDPADALCTSAGGQLGCLLALFVILLNRWLP